MSDNTSAQQGGNLSGSDDATGNLSGSDTTTGDQSKDFVSIKEFEKVLTANNWAQSKVKELNELVENLQSEIAASKKGDTKDGKKGDERLAQAESRIKELEKELSNSTQQVRNFQVKGATKDAAIRAGFREEAFEDFWKATGSGFDLENINGEKLVRFKEKPYMELDQLFDEMREQKPWFFSSQRTPGTGSPQKGATKAGEGESAVAFPADFANWSQSRKQEFFANLKPEQRAELRKQLPKM